MTCAQCGGSLILLLESRSNLARAYVTLARLVVEGRDIGDTEKAELEESLYMIEATI